MQNILNMKCISKEGILAVLRVFWCYIKCCTWGYCPFESQNGQNNLFQTLGNCLELKTEHLELYFKFQIWIVVLSTNYSLLATHYPNSKLLVVKETEGLKSLQLLQSCRVWVVIWRVTYLKALIWVRNKPPADMYPTSRFQNPLILF